MVFSELVLLSSLLFLLLVANGAPVIARKMLPNVAANPIDCGKVFIDRQPLLGHSKTIRGVFASLICTTCTAILLDMNIVVGVLIAVGAMLGDLFASFVKRRLHIQPSGQALLLDQVPETLLPLLLVADRFGLLIADIILLVVAFIALELVLSRILFKLKIRRRPY